MNPPFVCVTLPVYKNPKTLFAEDLGGKILQTDYGLEERKELIPEIENNLGKYYLSAKSLQI